MTTEEFINSIKLDGEEWRDVVGYEGYYMISSLGRIVSSSRYVKRKHRVGTDSNYITKPHLCSVFTPKNSPYARFVLYCGKPDRRLVHRIVAEAFVPNPNNYPEVDHINDNPKDNRACNLQWCTPKMNSSKEHRRKTLSITNSGRPASNRKPVVCLTFNNSLVKSYLSLNHAELDGFSHSAIHAVIHKKRNSHGGYKWMYLEDYNSLVNKSKNSQSTLD